MYQKKEKNKSIFKKIFLILITVLILSQTTFANEKYSYEKAEALKPLINWNDYGTDAFTKAALENKPIFLLLTAPSWCYWCQVYESTDYLFNENMIKEVNENFIPIYIDADIRQDLTRQYLEGGWPSTTILAPNGERIYGYSGPRPVENMITNLRGAINYVNENSFISSGQVKYDKKEIKIPSQNQITLIQNQFPLIILESYDKTYGGFGNGQKFPQPKTLNYALEQYQQTNNKKYLDLVENTLKNQYTNIDELHSNYNLFDPVEGGFHRYGTTRDWSPPHFEKMLYDNVELLKTYSNLQLINSQNPYVNEVVEKTNNYIIENYYDKENGGFYANSDVNGEDAYYGLKDRSSKEKSRIEKTKFTDWNSKAIIAYLQLYKNTNNNEYKLMAEKTLQLYLTEFDKDIYHAITEDKEKKVRGNLLDNSNLLLAFVEAHDTLNNQIYLEKANQIAKQTINTLYDYNSGGFFERNSPDKKLYALGDNVLLTKPMEENGIITYALLKLYTQTNNDTYLDIAIKTLGNQIDSIGGLDRMYYFAKSTQYINENNLMNRYNQIVQTNKNQNNQLNQIPQNYWLNNLLDKQITPNKNPKFVQSTQGITKENLNIIIYTIIAFLAGLLSFASPCTLPLLPGFIAHSFKSSKQNIIGMTFSLFAGLSLIFILLGMSSTFIGNILKNQLELFSQISGIFIVLLGMYILTGKGFKQININNKNPTTYVSSFIFGLAMGISWTPCVGPILVTILLLASTTTSAYIGGFLLFMYALGLFLPMIFFALYLKNSKNSKIWKLFKGKIITFKIANKKIEVHSSTLISGVIFILLGTLIFFGGLLTINKFVGTTFIQNYLNGLEGFLLDFIQNK